MIFKVIGQKKKIKHRVKFFFTKKGNSTIGTFIFATGHTP